MALSGEELKKHYAELVDTIESLEFSLSDEGGMVEAIAAG